jgi:hypothetical protein
MTHEADDSIQRALRDLQVIHASPGFTDRVMEGFERRKARRRMRNQLTLSAATAVVLAIMAGVVFVDRDTGPIPADLAREARLLLEEHARLENDFEALRADTRDAVPVLYLGGDDNLDLVLDLAPIIAQPAPAAAAAPNALDPYEL